MFEGLAEARIQDWIRRGRPHPPQVSAALHGGTLESQLLGEIVALRQSARVEPDNDLQSHLLGQARSRELQLLLLLERSGRPLAAKAMAELIQKI